jgi:hypothetical protein
VVDAELNRLLERAAAILEEDRPVVMQLAHRLIEQRVLSGSDVAEALASRPADTAVRPAAYGRVRVAG